MKINDLLTENTIVFDSSITSKEDLFAKAAEVFEKEGIVTNAKKFKKDLYKREKETSTGIEDHFGIPHAKSKWVTRPALAFIKSGEVNDYEALDGTNVGYSFVIAVPSSNADTHLAILSGLARLLMDEQFRDDLKHADSAQGVFDIFDSY